MVKLQTPIENSGTFTSPRPTKAGGSLVAYWQLLRPHQWVKNLLLFGGVVFSGSLLDLGLLLISVAAFADFCAVSSAGYILNDFLDLKRDREHPAKRSRPLASGRVRPAVAFTILAVLLSVSLVGAVQLGGAFLATWIAYAALSFAYSTRLKQIIIVDVIALAMGFVLRATAGAAVIGVEPSSWLILCTMMLALLVGFGKRRDEAISLGERASDHRATLKEYTVEFLDSMMMISAGAAFVAYALYTVADETVARLGSRSLILTTPFVFYGIARYLFLVRRGARASDPSRLFLEDVPTWVNVLLWVAVACGLIYFRPDWLPFD